MEKKLEYHIVLENGNRVDFNGTYENFAELLKALERLGNTLKILNEPL